MITQSHSPAAIVILIAFFFGGTLRAQEDRQTPEITVTASAKFSRISPTDEGVQVSFKYKYPTPYLKEPPKTYQCSHEAVTYLITTPDGKQHTFNLTDTKKETGHFTSVYFNLWTDSIFDSVGVRPGLFNGNEAERRFYWKQTKRPIFTRPGEYRLTQTGTFRDTDGALPDLPFRSTEAVWVVDPKAVSLKALKAKAQEAIQKRLSVPVPPVYWGVREIASGNRTVTGLIGPDIVPEDQVPAEQRKKGRQYWGTDYSFTFTPDGQLISEGSRAFYVRVHSM